MMMMIIIIIIIMLNAGKRTTHRDMIEHVLNCSLTCARNMG
jgi:hypothetical protein